MVYKTWSRHFSQNWHFYAMIGLLAAGIFYLAKQVYTLKNEIAASKKKHRKRKTTQDEYSNKNPAENRDLEQGLDDDDEPADEQYEDEYSEETEPETHNGEVVDEAEPLENDVENPKTREEPVEQEKPREPEPVIITPASEPAATSSSTEQSGTSDSDGVPKCSALLKSGKNSGKICGRVAMPESEFCRFHQK